MASIGGGTCKQTEMIILHIWYYLTLNLVVPNNIHKDYGWVAVGDVFIGFGLCDSSDGFFFHLNSSRKFFFTIVAMAERIQLFHTIRFGTASILVC